MRSATAGVVTRPAKATNTTVATTNLADCILATASRRSGPRGSLDEIRQQLGGVGRAQASDRVPSGRGRITRNGCGLIVADGHVEEVGGVLRRIGRDLVQGGIDVAKIAAGDLVGDGDQPCPLRGTATRATD